MKIINQLRNSMKELRNINCITMTAILLAMDVVLGFFTLQIGDFLKIGFSSIPHEIASYMFGPIIGAVFGALADVLKYIVKPTGAFFPGFTITGVVSGIIYGIVLYKKDLTLKNVILANVLVSIFANLLLNTYWLTILYGSSFMVLFPMRFVKEVLVLPINIVIVYGILKSFKRVRLLQRQS